MEQKMIRLVYKEKSLLFHINDDNCLDVIDHITLDKNVDYYEVCTEDVHVDRNCKLEKLIYYYFKARYSYKEICEVLLNKHNYPMSERNLRRFLKARSMKRKNLTESPIREIVVATYIELENSGFNLGYRSLWQRLQGEYGLTVKQKTLLYILRKLDPMGIEERKRSRLRRRAYVSLGPNHIWHVDGYDKIKYFGFPIHGCVDGFSKKVLWLEVSNSNNKPEVTATYFARTVKSLKCLPSILRTDKGNENGVMASMQQCLRSSHEDIFSGENSHIYGKSVHNQRVESMWGQLRHRVTGFYINLFHSMQEKGIINIHNKDHIECLKYCFGDMIAQDLERFVGEWNNHHIRRQRPRNIIGGKPNVLYDLPQKYGGVESKKPVNLEHLQVLCENYCEEPTWLSEESVKNFKQLVPYSVTPTTAREAVLLYQEILSKLQCLPNNTNA